jgi:hypothetical protein
MHIYLCTTWCAFEHQVIILHSHCVVSQEIELCQKDEEKSIKFGGRPAKSLVSRPGFLVLRLGPLVSFVPTQSSSIW